MVRAHRAAQGRDDVHAMIAFAPVLKVSSYLREIRALSLSRPQSAPPPELNIDPELQEAAGFTTTAETRAALGAIDLNKLERAPAPRMLVLASQPERANNLVEALEAVGVRVDLRAPNQAPADLIQLGSYAGIVLVDTPARDLPPHSYKRAAVLVPIFEAGGSAHLLLTKRTDKVEHHKGQISFPGGGEEPGDTSLLDTALRETYEEIGLEPSSVEIWGRLDEVQPSDVINPVDAARFLIDGRAAARLAVPFVRGRFFASGVTISPVCTFTWYVAFSIVKS